MRKNIIQPSTPEITEVLCGILDALLNRRVNPNRTCINESCNAPVDQFYEKNINKKCYKCACCDKEFYLMRGVKKLDKYTIDLEDYYEIAFRQIKRQKEKSEVLTAVDVNIEYGYTYAESYKILNSIASNIKLHELFQLQNLIINSKP